MRPEYDTKDPSKITSYVLEGPQEIEEGQLYVDILDKYTRLDDPIEAEAARIDASNIRQALHDRYDEVQISVFSGKMLMRILYPKPTLVMHPMPGAQSHTRKKVGTRT